MLTKIFSGGTIGLILGYLAGENLNFSGAIVKLSFLIIFISLFFIKKAKKDPLLKSCLFFVIPLIVCVIFSTIRSKVLKDEYIYVNYKGSLEVKIKDIKIKDSTKIITGKILNSNKNTNQNIVLYSYTQETLYPDDVILAEGFIKNEFIILPRKEETKNTVKSFDLMKYWETKGQNLIMMYPKLTKIENEDKKTHTIYYYSYIFRDNFYLGLEKVMNNENAGILMAMLWGDESHISKELNDKYREAGISHILVLSGYNLIIVAAFAGFIFKRLSLRKRIVFSIIFVGVFLMLANTSSPVWRASIMSLYTFLAIFFLRPTNARFIIWFTGFIFCLYSPDIAIYDVSFHMSFLATLSIIYFYPLIKDILYTTIKLKEKISFYKYLIEVSLVTLSANILILPYILFQFGTLKLTGIIISILVSGLVPVIMLFGFLGGVISHLSLYLGTFFGFFTDIFINTMSFMVDISYKINPLLSNGLSFMYLVILYTIIYIVFIFLEFYLNIRQGSDSKINKGYNQVKL